MRRIQLCLIAGFLATCVGGQSARAMIQFNKQFVEHYVGEEKDTEFAKEVLTAKCFVCHQGRKSKKNHNPYGDELAKLLDKKEDIKDNEKIIASLKKVEAIHTDPKDEKSPTYGDLIKAGKLPGGSLEETKKEPEAVEESQDGDAPALP